MYPKQHAVISAGATVLFGILLNGSPTQIALWTIIGVVAGVLIDVDHVILGMVIGKNIEDGIAWFLHPAAALTQPDQLLADMDYDALVYHRMISHVLVLAVLTLLIPVHPLLLPAAVGLTAHILADVVWDVKHGQYGVRSLIED